jgi:hypothetical protein
VEWQRSLKSLDFWMPSLSVPSLAGQPLGVGAEAPTSLEPAQDHLFSGIPQCQLVAGSAVLSQGESAVSHPHPNAAIPFEHPTPQRQRTQIINSSSPLVVTPRKPEEAHQLRLGHVEKLFEQRELYQLAADDEKGGSDVMLVSEQYEAKRLDWFQYKPRYDSKTRAAYRFSVATHSRKLLTHLNAINRRRRGRTIERKMRSIRK